MSQKRTADESNDDDDDVNDGSRKTPKLTRNGLHTEEEPFKPEPIDTSNIELPESILELRDCIAQSIHENWSVNKVDAGYKWGEARNDAEKTHPGLCEYDKLSEDEKSYDIDLFFETIKTVIAIGYKVSVEGKQKKKLKSVELPDRYRQANGYRPAPLDCSDVDVPVRLQRLVERLAANVHDVWASKRIAAGWRRGAEGEQLCSPHLVRFARVDSSIREANISTASLIVRLVLAHGVELEAPPKPEDQPKSEDEQTSEGKPKSEGEAQSEENPKSEDELKSEGKPNGEKREATNDRLKGGSSPTKRLRVL